MNSKMMKRVMTLTLGLAIAGVSLDAAARSSGDPHAVFVMTNASDGNAIIAYDRAADGSLTHAGIYSTGGLGLAGRPVNPLGSQGALVLSEDGRFLFAVNAGSNEISAFRVEPHGLTLVDIVSSGGDFPVSVTASGDLLYVLNAGGDGNITGFDVGSQGELSPIADSTRWLGLGGPAQPSPGATPGQIGFDPRGEVLVIAGKGTNLIHVFPVDADGLPSAAPTTSLSSGLVPFDFVFDRQGHLVVAEVGGDGVPSDGDGSTVSSYDIQGDGSLALITETLDDYQRATCWIAGAYASRYVYTANTGSNTLSGFEVDADGALTLVDNGVSHAYPAGTLPIDLAMSRDGRFVYTLNAGAGTVGAFAVQPDGGLVHVGDAGGVPALAGAQGIVVR